jgi:DNA polymerase
MEQIELINPKIIVLLGAVPAKTLIDKSFRISRQHGQWQNWNGYHCMPTYHPSALLRNPGLKKEAWEDFKNVVIKYREWVEPDHKCKYV